MKTHISLILSLALAGTVISHVSPARADDQAATDMARERFKEGVRFYDAGEYEKARASFLQAYALKAHPSVLLNLAQSELRSGYEADAANHFSEFLATAPEAKPEETASAQKGLDEAKTKVGEVPVTVDVAGAEVFVDGTSVGKAPLPRALYLAPGTHSLEARNGDSKATAEVAATAGASTPTTLSFKPPAPPPTAPAPVAAKTSVAAPPLTEPDSASSGRPPFFSWLFGSPVGLTGFGLTVAGAGLGVAGAIIASDHYSSAKDASNVIAQRASEKDASGVVCSGGTSPASQEDSAFFSPACADRQDRIDQGDTWRTVSIAGFAGAAVFGIGTVVYYLVGTKGQAEVATSDTQERTNTALIPVLGRDVQGMSLVGSF